MATAKSGRRILLVEDHLDYQRLLVQALTQSGYVVSAARSMQSALALAAAQPFDMVLCDFRLEDGSGAELMKELKTRYGLRGICLSGYEEEDIGAACRESGFERFLLKGVSIDDIQAAIEQVFAAPGAESTAAP